jgi:phosphoglycerate dehydrogenase-like enzyme
VGKPDILVTIPAGALRTLVFSPESIERLERLADITWNPFDRELDEAELGDAIEGKDACITGWGTHKFTDSVLDRAGRLKIIGHTAASLKGIIDESFYNRGILITNANEALAAAVAEYCLMVSLMASWRILSAIDNVKQGGWQTNMDVTDGLSGRTIGLVGYGAIARNFIKLLRPFDVKILVYSEHCPESEAKRMKFTLAGLEEVLRCDIVSLHKTLFEASYHIIDEEKLRLIRDGAIVINTARGALIDEAALVKQLESGRLNAVLDVFEKEPLPEDHILRRLPNVIATPHSGAATLYARRKQGELVIRDLELFFSGRTPQNIISREKYMSASPV